MGHILYNGRTVTGEGISDSSVIIDGDRIRKIIKIAPMTSSIGIRL